MKIIQDRDYRYIGYHGVSEGHCRIRIFVSPGDDVAADASFDPMNPRTWDETLGYTDPVIMVTDLPDNVGTSVTNMIEFIVGDILALWARQPIAGYKMPTAYVVLQENAPQDGVRNHSEYARVTFKVSVPMQTTQHCSGNQRTRWTVSEAKWSYITEDQVLEILSEAFTRYPALTHRNPIAEPHWAQAKWGNRAGLEAR